MTPVADGQPYLALEAALGLPISRWCREQQLPLAARLDLFPRWYRRQPRPRPADCPPRPQTRQCARHPRGQVKLLDFGIAKLLVVWDASATDSTTLTRATACSPPALCRARAADWRPVSVATDVYALGLMLLRAADRHPPVAGQTPRPRPAPCKTPARRKNAKRPGRHR